jgi:D-glycero-alpha-D-manno-heptose 1-phosphate guanylyltransferase
MIVTTAIILAGGLGTRLKKAVPNLPKPMAPILGRPFLEYQMDYWIGQGVNKFILSIGYLNQAITEHFGGEYRAASIDYLIEDKPLGTGGALLMAAQGLNEPFLVLNGDTFFEVDLNLLNDFHKEQRSEWTLSLFRANQSGRYMGLKLADNGEILALESGSSDSNLFNGGVYLINPSVFDRLDKTSREKISLENDLLPNFITSGGLLYGIECIGKFIDIGLPKDYHRAAEILLH